LNWHFVGRGAMVQSMKERRKRLASAVEIDDSYQSEQKTYAPQLFCPGGIWTSIILKNASLTYSANQR